MTKKKKNKQKKNKWQDFIEHFGKRRLLHYVKWVSWLSQSFGAVLLGYSHSLSNHCHLQPGNAENSSQIKRAEAQIGSQISRLSRISAVQPSRAPVRGGKMISWHFHNPDHYVVRRCWCELGWWDQRFSKQCLFTKTLKEKNLLVFVISFGINC